VNNATLNRFFALHFILPFVILALVLLHLLLLHETKGSSNPATNDNHVENSKFFPYFFYKDLFSLMVLLFILTFLIHFEPNYFGHPDNYIKANPLVTPAHIVPE
jgi:ubiquinol-cytochrome c reductase cytochrome b subunit